MLNQNCDQVCWFHLLPKMMQFHLLHFQAVLWRARGKQRQKKNNNKKTTAKKKKKKTTCGWPFLSWMFQIMNNLLHVNFFNKHATE